MALSDALARVTHYLPRLAQPQRRLSDDEVLLVAAGLTSRCAVPVGGFHVGVAITVLTDAMPSPEDVARVQQCLIAAGWPAADVFGTRG